MSHLTWRSHGLSVHLGAHTWESMECGRRSPELGLLQFWPNWLCGPEQAPSLLWSSDSQLSKMGLGLRALPSPMLHAPDLDLEVASFCWAGAWLRQGQECTGHSSGTLGLPAALFFGAFAGDLSTATKSKTSEDISQASKYSPAYSPDPYYAAESEYWTYHGSPKGSIPHGGAKARDTGVQDSHPLLHTIIHLFIWQTCFEGQPQALGRHWGANQPRSSPSWQRHRS